MRTMAADYARTHLDEVLDLVEQTEEPVYLTQDGLQPVVVVSLAEYIRIIKGMASSGTPASEPTPGSDTDQQSADPGMDAGA